MPLAELQSAAREANGILSRYGFASIDGKQFPVVCGSVARQRTTADAAFWANTQTAFHVLKTDLAGFSVATLPGKVVLFEGNSYRVNSVGDNGLRYSLTCEAEFKGR